MNCLRCAQENPDTAVYCSSCGQQIATPASPLNSEAALWRQFLGPRADYYLEHFRAFQTVDGTRFHPSWHWPAFGVGWLWFLYRKMYLHAAVFLIGGLLPLFLGAGLVGTVIWNGFAAVTANFLYYMHVKLTLATIAQRPERDSTMRDRLIADAGGIQPYVWWLGLGLMALAIIMSVLQEPALKK
jgi:hypothetical protein